MRLARRESRALAVGWGVRLLSLILGAGAVLAMGLAAGRDSPRSYTLGAYATDLAGRTPHQRYNARRAAAAIDGSVVLPGGIFSFNHRLGGWSGAKGYLRAPVSFDGLLIDAYGGGVCQTSTTLYNAALRAGLPVLERHPHSFAPGYVTPGLDAAVAYENVDLRFRNPYPWPLTIRAGTDGPRLVCRIDAPHPSAGGDVIRCTILDRFPPPTGVPLRAPGVHSSRWRVKGKDGLRVVVYRVHGGNYPRREVISDDTYQAIPTP